MLCFQGHANKGVGIGNRKQRNKNRSCLWSSSRVMWFFLVFFSHIRCFIRKCLGYNGVHETNKETSNRADP